MLTKFQQKLISKKLNNLTPEGNGDLLEDISQPIKRRRVTLRSRYGTSVDFGKKCVFCDKYCVCSSKCVFIIIKIKYVNSNNISDICDKLKLTTYYTYFTTDIFY
jgi:hypothetical protein